MATGNGAQELQKLEAALTGARRVSAPAAEASDDVVARVDAAAELCREVGRYASDHGRYLDEISAAFAERLQAMTKDYAANMLAAEERKMAELRRILGKIAGMSEAPVFVVTLAPRPGSEPYIAIRAVLKLALRRHGLRCVDIREVPQSAADRREKARIIKRNQRARPRNNPQETPEQPAFRRP